MSIRTKSFRCSARSTSRSRLRWQMSLDRFRLIDARQVFTELGEDRAGPFALQRRAASSASSTRSPGMNRDTEPRTPAASPAPAARRWSTLRAAPCGSTTRLDSHVAGDSHDCTRQKQSGRHRGTEKVATKITEDTKIHENRRREARRTHKLRLCASRHTAVRRVNERAGKQNARSDAVQSTERMRPPSTCSVAPVT
jgi:hypothetical protein